MRCTVTQTAGTLISENFLAVYRLHAPPGKCCLLVVTGSRHTDFCLKVKLVKRCLQTRKNLTSMLAFLQA